MRRAGGLCLVALAASLAAQPAQAAENLNCVTGGLTVAMQDGLADAFHRNVDPPAEFVELIYGCAATNRWSQEAATSAYLYSVFFSEKRFLLGHSALTPAQLSRTIAFFEGLDDATARAIFEQHTVTEDERRRFNDQVEQLGMQLDEARMETFTGLGVAVLGMRVASQNFAAQ